MKILWHKKAYLLVILTIILAKENKTYANSIIPERVKKLIPKELLDEKGLGRLGIGNQKVTRYAMTREECVKIRSRIKEDKVVLNQEKICGEKNMAPLFNPEKETMEKAAVCIDKFEFPNIECEYPLVWVKASEAAKICEHQGKRLCNAHEWEGACAGQLLPSDYAFESFLDLDETKRIKQRRLIKNKKESKNKTWSYGKKRKKGVCAMDSFKNEKCNGGDFKECGSNTYPAGAFPECKSKFDVYDLHGNAAEHMNLPVTKAQLAGGKDAPLGYTEMKGSWFIFDKLKAHKDYCRWRAPFWHGTKVRSAKSHRNYHLGFRCCKDLP